MEPKLMASFLTRMLMQFNDRINDLCIGGDIERPNLYGLVRNAFEEWEKFLQASKEKCTVDSKIDAIHLKQEAKVEKRILEYISMEHLVYTQDAIFLKSLGGLDHFHDVAKDNWVNFDVRELTPQKLMVYYEIVYQRLADFVPMLILMFSLKRSTTMLCAEMMDLRDECEPAEVLKEDSEASFLRDELHRRLARLTLALEKIRNVGAL
ncbi:hypothetical protein AAFF_G00310580 [Aldrovandia affinis]|uniref:GED domain-containing protein n=1 Tax=Aldrovandia affinis TaxID=143900 RepID=A0AAD7R814_9TELE|nr:hypothetical protein AAFF_G00310580 [Aldrovandia affinis]